MSYPGRSHQHRKRDGERRAVESAVTTNGEKSAEGIVGGNAEGPNEIQFMNFTIVRRFLRTVCARRQGVKAGNLTSEGKE